MTDHFHGPAVFSLATRLAQEFRDGCNADETAQRLFDQRVHPDAAQKALAIGLRRGEVKGIHPDAVWPKEVLGALRFATQTGYAPCLPPSRLTLLEQMIRSKHIEAAATALATDPIVTGARA